MSKLIDRTGETRTMNNGLEAIIISYRSNQKMDIEFENGQIVKNKKYEHFQNGLIKCPMLIKNMGGYSQVVNPNVQPEISFLIDNEDLHLLGNNIWSIGTDGYIKKSRGIGSLHRIIMCKPSNMQIDHINGDRLDNRRCNLRICTKAQNAQNRGKQGNNTSGMKGVHWDSQNKKWQAEIVANNKYYYLGQYHDKVSAAKAYNEAAIKHHGDFAKLNEI